MVAFYISCNTVLLRNTVFLVRGVMASAYPSAVSLNRFNSFQTLKYLHTNNNNNGGVRWNV